MPKHQFHSNTHELSTNSLSIDGDTSPDPSLGRVACRASVGSTTVAISTAQTAETQRRRERFQTNLNNTILMLKTFSREIFGVDKLRGHQKNALVRCVDPQLRLQTPHHTDTLWWMMSSFLFLYCRYRRIKWPKWNRQNKIWGRWRRTTWTSFQMMGVNHYTLSSTASHKLKMKQHRLSSYFLRHNFCVKSQADHCWMHCCRHIRLLECKKRRKEMKQHTTK